MVEKECTQCNGTGKEISDCEVCEGNGWVPDPKDGGTKTCPSCKDEDCSTCGGEGVVEVDEEDTGEGTPFAVDESAELVEAEEMED